MIKRATWIAMSFMALHLMALTPRASGSDTLRENFDSASVPAMGITAGRTGQGWSQPSSGEALAWPIALKDAKVGIVSFDLRRSKGPPADDLGTVFELLDEKEERVLRVQVNWSMKDLGSALFINSLPTRDYFLYGLKLWSPIIPLGREVLEGEWVHVDLFWDDGAGSYQAAADGMPLDVRAGNTHYTSEGVEVPDPRPAANEASARLGEPLPYPGKPFYFFLDRATAIAIGGFPVSNHPADRPRTLMKNLAVDNFEIRVGNIANIATVSHDAFSEAGYSGRLVAGEMLSVTMRADAGGTASFDVVQPASTSDGKTVPEKVRIAGVPLTEDPGSPGTYIGTYTVRYGDEASEALVVGRFANRFGIEARPVTAARPVSMDGRVHIAVKASSDLIPADRSSRSGLTVVATDANGRKIRDHQLALTLSTTDEYTGILGGSSFEDAVGGSLDVDWGGVTDSFGEVTARLVSGFAAKTMVVSARDMVSGDVGVGWVRSYIDGTVEIRVVPARTTALSLAGSMELSASREWLTADGRSRSRITAVVRDASGNPLSGHNVTFSLVGSNGSVKVVQSRTDSRGRAYADYVAGRRMGQVTIEIRDTTGGLFGSITIELRPDAPAKIALTADPAEVYVGGEGTTVTAQVLDINDNPNRNVDVIYDISIGEGALSSPSVATDEKGKAPVTFTPGNAPGTVTVRGTVTSRAPTAEEISAAEGAVFMYGLSEDPGSLEVTGWMVEAGDEVAEGQDLATLKDRKGVTYTVKAPRDGKVSVLGAEEGDEVKYGDTLGYILETE